MAASAAVRFEQPKEAETSEIEVIAGVWYSSFFGRWQLAMEEYTRLEHCVQLSHVRRHRV